MGYVIDILFLMIPVAVIAFFIVSLCLFISARKKNKQMPNSINAQKLSSRKIMLIISSAIAVVLVAVVIGLAILISLAIRNM